MNKFNYMPASPWSNPAGEIEKQTNELPVEKKAATKTSKRSTKKTAKTKKNKKTTKKSAK